MTSFTINQLLDFMACVSPHTISYIFGEIGLFDQKPNLDGHMTSKFIGYKCDLVKFMWSLDSENKEILAQHIAKL